MDDHTRNVTCLVSATFIYQRRPEEEDLSHRCFLSRDLGPVLGINRLKCQLIKVIDTPVNEINFFDDDDKVICDSRESGNNKPIKVSDGFSFSCYFLQGIVKNVCIGCRKHITRS